MIYASSRFISDATVHSLCSPPPAAHPESSVSMLLDQTGVNCGTRTAAGDPEDTSTEYPVPRVLVFNIDDTLLEGIWK